MKNMKLFVYGTLMKGEHNSRYLGNAKFLSYGETKPEYTLYSFGYYPAMVTDGKTSVKGEIYEVPLEQIPVIDELEEAHQYYFRASIILQNNKKVQTYLLHKDFVDNAKIIESGDWRNKNY